MPKADDDKTKTVVVKPASDSKPDPDLFEPTPGTAPSGTVMDPATGKLVAMAPIHVPSSIDPSAPPGGGGARKPLNYEPPFVHVHASGVGFTYVHMEPEVVAPDPKSDNMIVAPPLPPVVVDGAVVKPDPWVVHVGFVNEAAAQSFYHSFDKHFKNVEPVVLGVAPLSKP